MSDQALIWEDAMRKEIPNLLPFLMLDFTLLEPFILLLSNTNLKIQIIPSLWIKSQLA